MIANTLLDPIKLKLMETIKAAVPIFGTAAETLLNYTAKVWQATRDSVGK